MRDGKKGSITGWLSLVLCVIIALIFACIQSARLSAARACVSICMDESLFSEFARYDRILYDKYGLLADDAGFGSGSINFSAVVKEIDDAAEELLSDCDGLFDISLKETDITGYVLATDSGAASIRDQISSLMAAKLGIDGVDRLVNMVNTNEPLMRQQEETGSPDPESIRDIYDRQRAEGEARRAEAEAQAAEAAEGGGAEGGNGAEDGGGAEGGDGTEGSAVPAVEVPDDFVNPIENVETILRMGIYNTILPDPTAVSTRALDMSSLAETRTFQTGMGLSPKEPDNPVEHFLMAAYLTDFFPNFLSKTDGEGIRYQAEFAVAGKGSDAENLKSVLNRLLMIRIGLNYLYLNAFDPGKKAEAEAMALIIATIILMPESVDAIAQVLLLAWAFGESMMDLKTLLEGGKEPLIKDQYTWQLSLEQLASFSHETSVDSTRGGLSYTDHLILLLCMNSDNDLTKRTLDLLEYNRRLIGNEPSFSIDSCLTAIETETAGTIGDYEFSIRRSYGYDGK